MRNPLRRYYGLGDLHFVTFSCYRRRPLLGTPRSRDCFVRVLAKVRSGHEFLLFGYVVMPEHIHLLLSEPKKGTLSTALQVLKQNTSRALLEKRRKAFEKPQSLGSQQPYTFARVFWQRRFYDFNVWNTKKVKEKLEYVHANPVVRGLVEHPKDWPWSNWSYYTKGEEGMIRIDSVG